jgi:hypothetical protein
MLDIRIGRTGTIVGGDLRGRGRFVKIEDDSKNTGGFLILTSEDREFRGGHVFDDWVENKADLEGYFRESGWLVEWAE